MDRPDPMERERILTQAAEDYLRGRIDYDEHTRIRQKHRLDYRAAIVSMKRASKPWWQRLLIW